jgi:hypothetical protein
LISQQSQITGGVVFLVSPVIMVSLQSGISGSTVDLVSPIVVVGVQCQIAGGTLRLVTSNATVGGTVTGTTLVMMRAAEVRVNYGGVVACVGCQVDIELAGSGSALSALRLAGEIKAQTVGLSADVVEVTGSQTAWTGAVTIKADQMVVGSGAAVTVSAGSSILPAAAMHLEVGVLAVQRGSSVVCSGSGCMAVNVSARDEVLIAGSLSCTPLRCGILIDVGSNATVSVSGTLRGGDLNVTALCSVYINGSVSADGLGYGGGSGDGPGVGPTPGTSASSYPQYFYGSGGGGGHGGMGANSCYKSSSGSSYLNPQVYGAGKAYGSASEPSSFGSGGGTGMALYNTE